MFAAGSAQQVRVLDAERASVWFFRVEGSSHHVRTSLHVALLWKD